MSALIVVRLGRLYIYKRFPALHRISLIGPGALQMFPGYGVSIVLSKLNHWKQNRQYNNGGLNGKGRLHALQLHTGMQTDIVERFPSFASLSSCSVVILVIRTAN